MDRIPNKPSQTLIEQTEQTNTTDTNPIKPKEVNSAFNKGKADALESTSILKRNVSTSSVDSGIEIDDTLSNENIDKLLELADGEPSIGGPLNCFIRAAKKYPAIESFLKDESKTAGEKSDFLENETGLFSHMARTVGGTSPVVALFAIRQSAEMLVNIAENSEDTNKSKNILKQMLTISASCFEARVSHMQEVYANLQTDIIGVDNENVIDLKGVLDPEDAGNKIFGDKLAKYLKLFSEDSDIRDEDGVIYADKFIEWIIQEDGLIGFEAQDGEITKQKVIDFTNLMIDLDTMV